MNRKAADKGKTGMGFNGITENDVAWLKFFVGEDRASTGQSNLDLHSKDESPHQGVRPDIVVWPKSTDEVAAILKMANEQRIPVTPWGAGKGLEGNAIPVEGDIVLDFQLMDDTVLEGTLKGRDLLPPVAGIAAR
jgi:D-lactate dehydrogenase (cytochrome)